MSELEENGSTRRGLVVRAAGLAAAGSALSALAHERAVESAEAQTTRAVRFRVNVDDNLTVWGGCSGIGYELSSGPEFGFRATTVTLRRPLTTRNATLHSWLVDALNAWQTGGNEALETKLKNVVVALLNTNNQVVFRAVLSRTWPLRYAPVITTLDDATPLEELVLIPRRVSRTV